MFLLLVSCEKAKRIDTYYPSGELLSSHYEVNKKRNGPSVLYNIKGDTIEYEEYQNDTLNGRVFKKSNDGTKFLGFYKNNIPDSNYIVINNENDTVVFMHFDEGKISGRASFYLGTTKFVCEFLNGRAYNGTWSNRAESPFPISQYLCTYKNGILTDTLRKLY